MRFKRSLVYIVFIALSAGVTYFALSSLSDTLYPAMNSWLMPMFLIFTFFLLVLVSVDWSFLRVRDRFGLMVGHSFVTRIIYVILYFPGITGDNWQHLGRARTWDIFGQYYLLLLPDTPLELQSLPGTLYTVQRGILQQSLVVSISKMLFIDLYWVHLLFMGVLWSLFVPLIAFKISKMLGGSDTASILASFMVSNAPILLLWTSYPVPNSLGLFFTFLVFYFALKYISNSGRTVVFLLAISFLAAFLSHPLTGTVSASVILLAIGLKAYLSKRQGSRVLALLPLFLGFAVSIVLPTLLSVGLGLVYPGGTAKLSLDKFLGYDVYELIFAEYAASTFMKGLLEWSLLGLGVVGMILYQRLSKKKELSVFLILLFVSMVLQHRVLYYFVEETLFGTSRYYTFLPLIAGIFAALLLNYSMTEFKLTNLTLKRPNPTFRTKKLVTIKRISALLIICSGLSALVVEASLSDFRNVTSYGPLARVPWNAIETAQLIHEEYEKTGERYVVVADSNGLDAGVGTVGTDNPNEFYAVGAYRGLYMTALTDVSPDALIQAGSVQNSALAYLVVSKWSITRYLDKTADFQAIVNTLGLLYEQFAVLGSGDNQIYIFRYRIPLLPNEGIGPTVTLTKDSQQIELNTTYSYKTVNSVTYSLALTGAATYNVTAWPAYWSYETVLPPPASLSVDSNAWIYLTGLPNSTYVVEWLANNMYPNVGWKDDSFAQGYSVLNPRKNATYSFTSDGDIATETVSGTSLDIIYWRALPSLTGFKGVLIRAQGTPNSYFAFQMDNPPQEIGTVWSKWTKPDADFKTYYFPAPSNATFTRFWLLIKSTDGALATIYWDYVMLINQ